MLTKMGGGRGVVAHAGGMGVSDLCSGNQKEIQELMEDR